MMGGVPPSKMPDSGRYQPREEEEPSSASPGRPFELPKDKKKPKPPKPEPQPEPEPEPEPEPIPPPGPKPTPPEPEPKPIPPEPKPGPKPEPKPVPPGPKPEPKPIPPGPKPEPKPEPKPLKPEESALLEAEKKLQKIRLDSKEAGKRAEEITAKEEALEDLLKEEGALMGNKGIKEGKKVEEKLEPLKEVPKVMMGEGMALKGQLPEHTVGELKQKISPVEAKQSVSETSKLLMKMCQTALVGQIEGRPGLMLDLKRSTEVPRFFEGTTLTIVQLDRGLSVRFTNFESFEQERAAIFTVQQNTDALRQLADSLSARNVQLFEVQIGSLTITLPPPAPPEKPIEAPPPAREAYPERGGDERRGGGGGAGEGGEKEGRRGR